MKLHAPLVVALVLVAGSASAQRVPRMAPPKGPSGTCGTETFRIAGVDFPMVCIEAQSFEMGAPDEDAAAESWERPQHVVTIPRRYWIATTELTRRQWKAITGGDPSTFADCGDDCPVESIAWDDLCGGGRASKCRSGSFLDRLNSVAGTTKFRLPTEAEWELAARAGGSGRFPFGDCADGDLACSPCAAALSAAWSCGNSGGHPHPVATTEPNAWGLYDVAGNVWEWVADTWHFGFSGASSDGSSWEGGFHRMTKGGSWAFEARDLRSSAREYFFPPYRIGFIGVRLARSD